MVKISETLIGRAVVYTPRATAVRGTGISEFGTVTSVNDQFVFVRYGNESFSKATSPNDLRLGRK